MESGEILRPKSISREDPLIDDQVKIRPRKEQTTVVPLVARVRGDNLRESRMTRGTQS